MISVHDHGAFPPCPAPFNLAGHVLARAAERGERTALMIVRPGGAERWSHARLEAAVRGTATGLLRLGLPPGARILLRLGNSVEFPLAFLGAVAAGLVPVPSSALLTVPEVTRIAALVGPALIVAAPGVALPEAPGVPVLSAAALRGFEALPPARYEPGDPDRLAYVVFTSGSSGQPRAVGHAHRAIWARGMMIRDWYGLTPEDRLLHAGAFNWTYTLGTGLLDPWSQGALAMIPAEGVTPAQAGLLLRRFDATIFAAAPGVYRQMLKHPLPALPRLRHGLSAGEALPGPVREAWAAATGTPILEALGMSECSTFVSASPDRPAPPGATGYPQAGRRVAVLGPDGAPVARGSPGILAVSRRDPGLFLGYIGAEAETMAAFRGEWFLTGDVVRMEADGAITYLGREDGMLNAGGYRVSPLEVEAALNAHPAVAESAAVELRVKADATVIAAFYQARGPVGQAALAEHLAARLARYKQPRLLVEVAALPRTPNGKIDRRALREDWEARH